MKSKRTLRPIGLASVTDAIDSICENRTLYARCGLKPEHFVVPLDAGNGRTTLVRYMKNMYKQSGILDFDSGLDDFIEIEFDGTMQQLKKAFSVIESAAVYANNYTGIVAIDISAIAAHINEAQCAEFLSRISVVCRYACVLFFVKANTSPSEEKLIAKICDNVQNVRMFQAELYSTEDVCEIVLKNIRSRGVLIDDEDEFKSVLLNLLQEHLELCNLTINDITEAVLMCVKIGDTSVSIGRESLERIVVNVKNNGRKCVS